MSLPDPVATGDMMMTVAGETLLLLPELAVYWPALATLLVADLHWGKAATFRAGGLPVPSGTTASGLSRLSSVLNRTGARRVVLLGDLLHAREGRSASMLAATTAWRAQHAEIEMILVRGNHDRRAGDPPPEGGMRCVDAPMIEPPFVFAHYPVVSPDGFVLAGHLHPAALLRGAARQSMRLPCFWLRERYLVLPAFGELTGTLVVEPVADDRLFIVVDGGVMAAPVSARHLPNNRNR